MVWRPIHRFSLIRRNLPRFRVASPYRSPIVSKRTGNAHRTHTHYKGTQTVISPALIAAAVAEVGMADTFPHFLTVATAPDVRRVIDWNSPEGYRNTSPGQAIRRHLEMFPGESPVAVRPAYGAPNA
jgi:hypothetical protein